MAFIEKDRTILKPIKGKIKEKNIVSFDTEDDGQGNMVYGNIYDGKEHLPYETPAEFLSLVRDISLKYGRSKVTMVATNLEYDMVNSFKGYYNRLDLMYASKLINFGVKDSNVRAIDSLNHYMEGVKKQGEMIGINKIDISLKDIKKGSKEMMTYCNRDAEITYKRMAIHQKSINKMGAELRDTAAGTAMNLFRRKYLPENIKRPDDETLDFMKTGYYGGRTEIFNIEGIADKDNSLLYYDINSLYPKVMQKNNFPNPNTIYKACDIDAEGVSEVLIEYRSPESVYIPYLPVKHKFYKNKEVTNDNLEGLFTFSGSYESTKLMFPVGKFRGVWTNFELRYAINKGLINVLKVYKSVNFKESLPYFKDYMTDMYAARKKHQAQKDLEGECMQAIDKLFMNSLYGKFFEHVDSDAFICDETGIIEITPKDNYYPAHSNGIWSMYTTAYARTDEYEGLLQVHEAGGKLLYCDTDCIQYIGKEGILKVSKELGDFKLEGKFKYGRYYLPKSYILVDENNIGKAVAKGIPQFSDDNDADMFDEFLEGFGGYKQSFKMDKKFRHRMEFLKNGYVKIRKPVRFKESARSIEYRGKANVWRDMPKRMQSIYMKRVILKNGDTRPYILKDGILK